MIQTGASPPLAPHPDFQENPVEHRVGGFNARVERRQKQETYDQDDLQRPSSIMLARPPVASRIKPRTVSP
jgi:hypothetical protein